MISVEPKPFRLPPWYVPISVLFLGMLSIGMLIGADRIGQRQIAGFALADATMDIQIHMATSHLSFVEAVTGSGNEGIQNAFLHLGLVEQAIKAIQEGGNTEDGLFVSRPDDPEVQSKAADLALLFGELNGIALEVSRESTAPGTGLSLDERFNTLFEAFQGKAYSLERMVEEDQVRFRRYSRRLFFGILCAWVAILAIASRGLWIRERRRAAADEALKEAHALLQLKAEELNRHRDHLQERVKERTVELEAANSNLRSEIVERIHAEESIRVYEEAIRNMPLGLYIWQMENGADPSSFKLIAANPAGAEIVGMKTRDLLGRTVVEVFPGLRGSEIYNCIHEVCRAALPKNFGEVSYGDECVSRGYFAGKVFLLPKNSLGLLLENVTEKVRLQAEASQASHLAALGELAAGVAHEINNPVNGVINYAQILIDDLTRKKEDPSIPGAIIREGRHIAGIVRSLLSFARQGKGERHPVLLQYDLGDAIDLARAQIRKDRIELHMDVPHDLPEIHANSGQIQQVFLNLVNNARYALNQKYPGADENKIMEIAAEDITVHGARYIKVSVFDAGVGIPAQILQKVILPFFSTKPIGVGTGLGLSISHGIVTDHGGEFLIHSKEGEYTLVEVLLPVTRPPAEDAEISEKKDIAAAA